MRVWVRQSGNSPEDRIRFYNVLAAGVVTVGIVSSLTLAVPIHYLLRKTHQVSAEFQAPPAGPLAPAAELVGLGAPPDMSVAALEAAATPEIAAPRTPLPIPRPQVTERVALPKPRPNPPPTTELASARQEDAARRSRNQVERNVRHQRSLHDAVDAIAASAAQGGADLGALIVEARRHLGTNPTTRARLWCARFMNLVLQRTGYRGTGSDLAMSFAKYGHQISRPRVGAIAVMRRKGGGHVGIVTAVPGKGRIVLLSGNDGRRVRERVRSTRNVVAYVMPQRGSSTEYAGELR
jgi:uncharacterized protein (TIGR02594 family)